MIVRDISVPDAGTHRKCELRTHEPAPPQNQPLKVFDRWPYLILTMWLTVAGCLDSRVLPNGITKPREAYRTESATTVPLPSLANQPAFTQDSTLFSINSDGTCEQAIPLAINVSGKASWSSDGAYLPVAGEADGGTDIFILLLDDDGAPIGRYNMTRSPD
ncbi:MAG: hypothetical protein MUQ30_17315, partial [Anaerolineae bacterium]|nr:hypothetical protein [Anaerolineae bacterium]